MHISIIIPAFNEERLIGQCLQSVTEALAANHNFGFTHEIIVVDNNSTDNTARLAKQAGARVIFEPINHIARARTAGAAAANGDWLIFLDADCLLSEGLLTDIFQLIKEGKHVGAGSTLLMPGQPWWANAILKLWTMLSVLFGWAAGALMVCNRKAFHEIGGFNLELYAAEEIEFSQKLKKWGQAHRLKFTILTAHPLETSARKIKLYSRREVFGQLLRLILHPHRSLHDKKWLSMWYDGRR
ncbi:glycosyltransferase [Nitrosomonas sp. Nm33]|uniref:glycosyltransferase n=1 Tax=Nitrosomonas sp. Nm33 TaxID=133724 RepID=UPI00089BBED9|nr:glycosyltransferase [Nitrosomonas sp. Nm33]SDY66373.1 Glycosyltransferase involved in cell wall bisynthesis [Nitrosomonas sp. Nm33]